MSTYQHNLDLNRYNFQGESNVIEVYIRYLRRKLEKEGHKRLLQTVRGLGYVLRQS